MPPAEGVRNYLVTGIEGTPAVLKSLFADWREDDARWDERPDPERFTMREMIAHVADWDPIFLQRVSRLRSEDNPMLESVDEGELAKERDYASQSPTQNLRRLEGSRPELVALLRSMSESEWDRVGHRGGIGDVTMFDLVVTILGHDGYHTKQAAENVKGR
ncbi:MAG: DinB family protein [Armatimonadetes bacterium]|nr:DinB family protein [Armatimonadota bacterium]